jgi:hypothetical protein
MVVAAAEVTAAGAVLAPEITEVLLARLAPPLLHAEVRGVRVPKQTSAEATNGLLVST